VLQRSLEAQGIAALMAAFGRSNRTKFRDQVLNPLIEAGSIEMTIPDKPRSSKQEYRLTQKGRALLGSLKAEKR
jgi:ATP-dependent DNA helicase RecG